VSAVELSDFREMNLGNTNLVIAVLPLLLFFGNELAMAELAFQDRCAYGQQESYLHCGVFSATLNNEISRQAQYNHLTLLLSSGCASGNFAVLPSSTRNGVGVLFHRLFEAQ
jgi:hypothetical protein